MGYFYCQKEGGNEVWKLVLDNDKTVDNCMFKTVLALDTAVPEEPTKEQLAEIKYKGPLYFDLDDAESPASTAQHVVTLIDNLSKVDVEPSELTIFASGGKGFHVIVDERIFLAKPPRAGIALLPAIYKEMSFQLAVDSMDFRVYTARRGRMFRQVNIKRPNGLYKVQITLAELQEIAEAGKEEAEEMYAAICAAPRPTSQPESFYQAAGLMAMFDTAKAAVSKASAKRKKAKPVNLPKSLPSFEAMLQGRGIKDDAGFHQLAMQIAITSHQTGMTLDVLLEKAEGLIQTHQSDGARYDTAGKRRAELRRMWEYTEDNPCYDYNAGAISNLLTHRAPDLHGLEMDAEETEAAIEGATAEVAEGTEYDHAGIVLNRQGAFIITENGPKQVTAVTFDNVTELLSTEKNQLSVIEADVYVGGKKKGRDSFTLETFQSSGNLNKVASSYGQIFSGNDNQARGVYLRMVEKARRKNQTMYVIAREGLDYVQIPFHDDPEMRDGFLVWSDSKEVVTQDSVKEKVALRFVGWPDERGQFQTDLGDADNLVPWLKEDGNKELMKEFLDNLLNCQKPSTIGKLLGWTTACHYRMMFHEMYKQFPLMHINGPGGMGKTQMTLLFAAQHYFREDAKMLSPTSTLFAVAHSISSSASIPLILDEFKPSEMPPNVYDKFKLMMRDAYNCRTVERGGGTRDNSDYRSVHRVQLSAPVCFIAEAVESEPALMERVLLLTLIKPDIIKTQVYHKKFVFAQQHKYLLGMIGKYITATVVKRYSKDLLDEEFTPVLEATRKEMMLQEGEEGLSVEDYRRKSTAKERTVFNYAVARFGLMKFRNLIKSIYGDEFENLFDEMSVNLTDSAVEVQEQTTPEWLKVLNTFANMAIVDELSPYHMKEGKDFAFVEYNNKPCFEMCASVAYFKYRAYCAASRTRPLFPSASAFTHTLNSLSALEVKNYVGDLNSPGGSHILSLESLRQAGFITPRSG